MPVPLVPRPVAASVDELLDGARRLGDHRPADARSSAGFERVEVDGEPCLVKYMDPTRDFMVRVSGDIGCRPRRVWAAGLMDVVPERIDHATHGVAPWGPNGWGAAILMRDVGPQLVPVGDDPVSEAAHLGFLDGIAALAAALWDWTDDLELLPHPARWAFFGISQLEGEAALGFPEAVPRIASEGWERFDALAPAAVRDPIRELRLDPYPLSEAVLATPQTFLHGDWKLFNLGADDEGRTILLDWEMPGRGPGTAELAWYLAINCRRLPLSKDSCIAIYREALESFAVDTEPWWNRQLALALLGGLVQFGWEKCLGGYDDELAWWEEAALRGATEL